MKIINHIVIFDDDKYLFALLKGYCYANSISINSLGFTVEGIGELEKLKPVLVIIPVEWLNLADKRHEAILLKQANTSDQVKVCSITKNPAEIVSTTLPAWVDLMINMPVETGDLDNFLKTIFALKNCFIEKRNRKERRSSADRRAIRANMLDNNGYHEITNPNYLHQPVKRGANDFHIDYRNKCVLIKSHKVELTPKEFELIELLSTDVDRIFMAEEIINHLWPESSRATKSDLYQYMHLLRKKIEKDPNNPQWIQTVKGFGYKLNIGKPEQLTKVLNQINDIATISDTILPIKQSNYM